MSLTKQNIDYDKSNLLDTIKIFEKEIKIKREKKNKIKEIII